MIEKEKNFQLAICLENQDAAELVAAEVRSTISYSIVRVYRCEGKALPPFFEESDFLFIDLPSFLRQGPETSLDGALVVLFCAPDDVEPARKEIAEGRAFDLILRMGPVDGDAASRIASYFKIASPLRKRFDTTLSALERRYENLVQALPDIVYEIDIDGRFRFLNDAVRLLGYTPEELIGKHFSEILYPADAQAVDRNTVLGMYKGVATGFSLSPKLFNERRGLDRKTENLEIRIKRKPGSGSGDAMIATVISFSEVSAVGEYGLRAGKREFIGSVGIIRDVTLRRKSEETLRKLYQAVDQLSDCVCIMNRSFQLEYINPAFLKTTQFAPQELLGHELFEFLQYAPERIREFRSLALDGFNVRDETTVLKSDGGTFWASMLLSPVRSPEGVITHAIAILEDISARRTMEDLLRTSKEEAETTARAKSDFLVNMANELKSPVSAILSAAQLIRVDPSDSSRQATQIIKSARSLLETLTGTLELLHSESREEDIPLRAFPLGSFVRRICEPYKERAAFQGLSFDVRGEDCVVESDPDRLGRIIGILADNAINSTGTGGVTVEYVIDRQEGNIPHLVLTIHDTGEGLSVEAQARIFEPFWGDGGSYAMSNRGVGVGLALARNLTRALGGEIRVESSPDGGSSFSVLLPAGSPSEFRPGESPSSLPYTLLVVDDNEVNLEYMSILLEAAGHSVATAPGGAQALRLLETRLIDAVLLDIQMPGMSGVEFARRVRDYAGDHYAPDIPLIALTAFDPSDLKNMEFHFDAVFDKPMDIHRLISEVDRAVTERDAASVSMFREKHPGDSVLRSSLLAKVEASGTAALTTLSAALDSGLDVQGFDRIDARAAAQDLVEAFEELAAPGAAFAARQLEFFFPSEDPSVLGIRLARLRHALGAATELLKGQNPFILNDPGR